jgi:hypothetical protein
MSIERESRVATPLRSMLAGRILMMSLAAEASAGTSRGFGRLPKLKIKVGSS